MTNPAPAFASLDPALPAPMQAQPMSEAEIAATVLLHDTFAAFHYSDICAPGEIAGRFLAALGPMPGQEPVLLGLAHELEREVRSLPAAAREGQLFTVELRRADTQPASAASAGGLTRLIVLPTAGEVSPRGTVSPRHAADFCENWEASGEEALFFTAAPSAIAETDRIDRARERETLTAQQVDHLDRLQGRMLFEAMAATMESFEASTMLIGQLKSLRGQIALYRQNSRSEEKLVEISRNIRGESQNLMKTLERGVARAAALPPHMQHLGQMLRGFQTELRATGVAAARSAPRLTAVRQTAPAGRAGLAKDGLRIVRAEAKTFDRQPIFSARAEAVPMRGAMAGNVSIQAVQAQARPVAPQATAAAPAFPATRAHVSAAPVPAATVSVIAATVSAQAQVSQPPAATVPEVKFLSAAQPSPATPRASALSEQAPTAPAQETKAAPVTVPAPGAPPEARANEPSAATTASAASIFVPVAQEQPAASQTAYAPPPAAAEKATEKTADGKIPAASSPEKSVAPEAKSAAAVESAKEQVDRIAAQMEDIIKNDPENYLSNPAYIELTEKMAAASEKMPVAQAFGPCANGSCPCGVCAPSTKQTIQPTAAAITRPLEKLMGRSGSAPTPAS